MKIINILILIGCSFAVHMSSQQKCDSDIIYSQAFCKIAQDTINSKSHLYVSDYIVDLDRFWYSDMLSDSINRELVKSFRSRKQYKWEPNYYCTCLHSLFNKEVNNNFDKIIFFSRIEDNMLRADVLNYCKGSMDYDSLSLFGSGEAYLFICDSALKIIKTYKIKINFN